MKKRWFFSWGMFLSIFGLCIGAGAPSDVRVSPMMTTQWGQTTVNGNSCFNYYTPDSSGYPPVSAGSASNYPSGCVATAMGQVVNFHQWAVPQFPFGTTFTIYADGWSYSANLMGGTLPTGDYDWALMTQIGMIQVARPEAGRLMHDLGAVLGMQYYSWANWGSATDFDNIDNAFNGFSYSNAVTIEGNYVSGGVLLAQSIPPAMAELAITTNLDAGLPVIIGINTQNLQNGHALVLDGYGIDGSGTKWFHWNFGLPVQGVTPPATNLGWFTLPGVGTTNDSAGYSVLDGIAFNVFKAVPVPAFGEIISGRVTDTSGSPLSGMQVDITSPNPGFVPVTVFTNSNGIYASYGTIVSNQNYTVSVSGPGYAAASQGCSVGQSQKQWVDTVNPPNGDGYYNNTVGNVQVDFALTQTLNIPQFPVSCDFFEYSGLAGFWNSTHSLSSAPDIRYDYNGDWSVDFLDLRRLMLGWFGMPVEFRTEFDIFFNTPGPMPAKYPWQYGGMGGAWSISSFPFMAAQSAVIGNSQSTSLKLPVKVMPGVPGTIDIMFDLECDTEMNADVFEFLVNGQVQQSMGGFYSFSGQVPMQMVNYQVTGVTAPQLMTLEWRYTKDAANSMGLDAVWIGNVLIIAQP